MCAAIKHIFFVKILPSKKVSLLFDYSFFLSNQRMKRET